MVNPVSTGGYQAYSYQQAVASPVQEQRGGENRIEARKAPAGDANKSGKDFSARGNDTAPASSPPANSDRGNVVDLNV